MFGGLEAIIMLVPVIYLPLYIAAWLYTRRRFP
jgi:hypothetical protein